MGRCRQQRGVATTPGVINGWREDRDPPDRAEGTGTGRQGRPRERAARARARGLEGAPQVPESQAGVREDETRALTVAPSCGGHTPNQPGAGQGMAGKHPPPEVLEGDVAPQEEGHGQRGGTRQPPVWPAGEDRARLAARPCHAGAYSTSSEATGAGSGPWTEGPQEDSAGRRGASPARPWGSCQPPRSSSERESTVTPNLSLLNSYY